MGLGCVWLLEVIEFIDLVLELPGYPVAVNLICDAAVAHQETVEKKGDGLNRHAFLKDASLRN